MNWQKCSLTHHSAGILADKDVLVYGSPSCYPSVLSAISRRARGGGQTTRLQPMSFRAEGEESQRASNLGMS